MEQQPRILHQALEAKGGGEVEEFDEGGELQPRPHALGEARSVAQPRIPLEAALALEDPLPLTPTRAPGIEFAVCGC